MNVVDGDSADIINSAIGDAKTLAVC